MAHTLCDLPANVAGGRGMGRRFDDMAGTGGRAQGGACGIGYAQADEGLVLRAQSMQNCGFFIADLARGKDASLNIVP